MSVDDSAEIVLYVTVLLSAVEFMHLIIVVCESVDFMHFVSDPVLDIFKLNVFFSVFSYCFWILFYCFERLLSETAITTDYPFLGDKYMRCIKYNHVSVVRQVFHSCGPASAAGEGQPCHTANMGDLTPAIGHQF